jgi:U3 small nucleolar RNA-associated protein 15
MSNGLLSIRKQNMKTADLVKPPAPLRGGNAIYFGRGSDAPVDKDTLVIGSLKYKKMAKYDKYLRSFQYANALDATLENGADPDLVTVMIQELVHREGVRVALTGRDEKSLLPILKFISKHINNPRYNMQLIQVADIIIGICS